MGVFPPDFGRKVNLLTQKKEGKGAKGKQQKGNSLSNDPKREGEGEKHHEHWGALGCGAKKKKG